MQRYLYYPLLGINRCGPVPSRDHQGLSSVIDINFNSGHFDITCSTVIHVSSSHIDALVVCYRLPKYR